MKKFEQRIFFLVVPLTRYSLNNLNSFELKCGCTFSKVKKKNLLLALNQLIEELYFSTSWKNRTKMLIKQKIVFLVKIFVKRPKILYFIFFNRRYELYFESNCLFHLPNFNNAWYSNTASRIGFPWAFDVQSNGLDMLRNQNLQILIFASGNNLRLNFDILGNSPKTTSFIAGNHNTNINYVSKILNSWQRTNLIEVDKIDVLHGSVLTKFNRLYLHNLNDEKVNFPDGLKPNQLWSEHSEIEDKLFFTPTPTTDLGTLKSAVHINASSNFYHFISESLRSLIMAIEIKTPVENIIIRSGLPKQFYEIIKLISPNSKLITLNQSERIQVKKLIYSEYRDCLSSDANLFRGMPLSEIRQSDEWMIWNWIREKWAPSKKSSYRLYFKRLKYESRGIINGVRVQNRLEKRGFRILDTSEMSFSHQKELFSATSTVCSTTGASLLNMIFLRENSKILEIGYPSGDSWQFLADLLGMNYSRLEIESRLPIKTLETLDFYYARLKKIDRLVSNLI